MLNSCYDYQKAEVSDCKVFLQLSFKLSTQTVCVAIDKGSFPCQKKRAFFFSEEYSKTNMENCGGPKSNSILIPTVEIKAAFTVWLLHGMCSFSCENGEDLCYVLQSNLLFLEINTRYSKTYRKRQARPVMLRVSHTHGMWSWPGEGEEYLTRQGCQNFPLKSWPFTFP